MAKECSRLKVTKEEESSKAMNLKKKMGYIIENALKHIVKN